MRGLPQFIAPFDLETRSRADLRRVGGAAYAEHPSTELLSAGWLVGEVGYVWSPRGVFGLRADDVRPRGDAPLRSRALPRIAEIVIHEGPEPPPWLDDLTQIPWVAHRGAGFDRPVWEGLGLPRPAEWLDTMPWCSLFGLPRNIDSLGLELFGVGKDAGKDLALQLCQPETRGRFKGRFLPVGKRNAAPLIRYMLQDVRILAGVVEELRPLIFAYGEPELAVVEADAALNERGVAFDSALAREVVTLELKLRDHTAEELVGRIGEHLELDSAEAVRAMLRSPQQVRAALERYDVVAPDAKKATLRALALETDSEPARDIIAGRIGETRVTSAKLERGLATVSRDGRLRHTLAYHTAATGRWSGQGMQLHNLPRPNGAVDVIALGAALLREGGVTPEQFLAMLPLDKRGQRIDAGDALAALVRATIIPPSSEHVLLVADYANIEARVLPWLANDLDSLAVFWRGGDPYVEMGAVIFGAREAEVLAAYKAGKEHPRYDWAKGIRDAGKASVLGNGFGLGAAKFDDYAKGLGVNLARSGTSAPAVVEAWRDRFYRIAGTRTGREWQGVAIREGGFWRELDAAFRAAMDDGRETQVGRVHFSRWRGHVLCELPSGRRLWYRDARTEERERFGKVRPTPCYTHYLGRSKLRRDTYGGKLAENVTQACARDFLAAALVRLVEWLQLHVHDEVVGAALRVEAQARLEQMLCEMTRLPAWAEDIPIGAEGFICERYRKGDGTAAALNGVLRHE
jgi:DNA polymerase